MTASIEKPLNLTSASDTSNLRLKDILKTLPREVFVKNPRKAWTKVIVNVLLVAVGYVGIAVSPWYLLPLMWIFTGTGLTGFFVIGHDCGHRSFANRRWVNDLVGHLAFLPLMFPFHAWRHGHNYHHKHTNKIGEDNAWQPMTAADYAAAPKALQIAYSLIFGPMWWVGSIAHWAKVHFMWWRFKGQQKQEQVRFSVLVVVIAAAIGFPLLIATTGIWGFVKFWFIPWMVYHFWMSTFTIVHHTAPDISFKPAAEWNEAQAQLSGTVHCDYPRWVEFLCHDINVHVPHHLSTAIPWYNLRLAHSSLKENWQPHLYETKFSWSLMKRIADNCHLYNPAGGYLTLEEFNARTNTNFKK